MSQKELFAAFLSERGIAFERDVPLKERCSFRIGGPADFLVEPAGREEIAAVTSRAREMNVPWMVMGRGSNVLFSDEGFRGAVLRLGARFAAVRMLDDTALACESGLSLSRLCEYALRQGLSGLEFAYGIPGTVGGGIYMNAGAYGGEMKDVLLSVSHLEADGSPGELAGEEMELSYRRSAYSGNPDSGRVITGAALRLTKGDPDGIKAKMDGYMNSRREKQPLELPSAGSAFRRPPGNYASALIDGCGLKGFRVGGAMVSEKHAGFVVNAGGATCGDVLALIERVRGEVLRQTGYALECEVRIIGEKG